MLLVHHPTIGMKIIVDDFLAFLNMFEPHPVFTWMSGTFHPFGCWGRDHRQTARCQTDPGVGTGQIIHVLQPLTISDYCYCSWWKKIFGRKSHVMQKNKSRIRPYFSVVIPGFFPLSPKCTCPSWDIFVALPSATAATNTAPPVRCVPHWASSAQPPPGAKTWKTNDPMVFLRKEVRQLPNFFLEKFPTFQRYLFRSRFFAGYFLRKIGFPVFRWRLDSICGQDLCPTPWGHDGR